MHLPRDLAFVGRAQRTQNVAARGLDVRFIDMNDQLCASARCATVRNGVVMFADDNHLTASFSRALGGILGDRLEVALSSTRRELAAGQALRRSVRIESIARRD